MGCIKLEFLSNQRSLSAKYPDTRFLVKIKKILNDDRKSFDQRWDSNPGASNPKPDALPTELSQDILELVAKNIEINPQMQ